MKKLASTLLALIILWEGFQEWPIPVHIEGTSFSDSFSISMPRRDKKRLEAFFRDTCFLNTWSYTLLGSKPLSLHQYKTRGASLRQFFTRPDLPEILQSCFWPPNLDLIASLFQSENSCLQIGCSTLQKYLSKMPTSRFDFYVYPPHPDGTVSFILVDKVRLVKTVQCHENDFATELQASHLAPEDLLDPKSLHSFLSHLQDPALIGILLGYGRENSLLFRKCADSPEREKLLTSAWPEEEVEHLHYLNQTSPFQPWDLSHLFYPRFACDLNSDETKRLKERYRSEREEIKNFYRGRDVVEATLSLLCLIK